MATITSTSNDAVKSARKLARSKERARSGEFLVEGLEVIGEAVGHLRRVFVAREAGERAHALAARAQQAGADILEVSDLVLEGLAATSSPQGIVGVARLPVTPLGTALEGARLVIAAIATSDPGNAGTIIRTADAAGADAVVLTAGSVDARNPKAVRASAGSIFHLPVAEGVSETELLGGARDAGLRIIGADARGEVDYTDLDLNVPALVLFGNEAHGLSAQALQGCDTVARVPLHSRQRPGHSGTAESLNLAATVAVLAFEAARQRRVGDLRAVGEGADS